MPAFMTFGSYASFHSLSSARTLTRSPQILPFADIRAKRSIYHSGLEADINRLGNTVKWPLCGTLL